MKLKKCASRGCRNKVRKGYLHCCKCINRRYREIHPEQYAYQTLKQNAKRRGKTFELTFDQFCRFAYKYEYLSKKGRSKEGYSIDRIDVTKGYSIDNIQVLTVSKNSIKRWKEYDYKTGIASNKDNIIKPSESDDPF